MGKLFLAGRGVYTPRTETSALAARMVAAGGASVSRVTLVAMDAFFATAASSTWWAKLDALYILKANEFASASQNWKSASYTLTNTSAVFTAWNYMSGGGTAYLTTGFNPALAAGQMSQNSAHVGWWQYGAQSSNYCMGAGQNIRARGGSSATYRLNTASTLSLNKFGYGDASGHYVLTRSDAALVSAYHEGVNAGDLAGVSAPLENANMTLIGSPSVGQYSAQSFSVFHFGSGLTALEVSNLRWALKTLMVGLNGNANLAQSLYTGGVFTSNAKAQDIHNASKPWSLVREASKLRFEVRNGENCAAIFDDTTRERSEISFASTPRLCGMTVNNAAKTLTLTGTPFAGAIFLAANNNGLWTGYKASANTSNGYTAADFINAAGYKRYAVRANLGDTLSTLATALAAKLAVDFAGASALGAVITVPNAHTLEGFSGGDTMYMSYQFKIEPSPLGASKLNDAAWGPVLGQIHNQGGVGDIASPPFAFSLLPNDTFIVASSGTYYSPRYYATNTRNLYTSATPLARTVWHHLVIKYTNGLGIDLTPATGQSISGPMGPNWNGANNNAIGTGYGALKIWLNGAVLLDLTDIPIGYPDVQPDYFKCGIYRSSTHTSGDNFAVQYQNVEVSASDLSGRVSAPLAIN